MTFLIFDSEEDYLAAIEEVNNAYGCPIKLPNGYEMRAFVVPKEKSNGEIKWGFTKPKTRLGKTGQFVMGRIRGNFSVLSKRPRNWRKQPRVLTINGV